jgi:hypothetical protein
MNTLKNLVYTALLVQAALVLSARGAEVAYFVDGFESGLGNWIVSGQDWGLTNSPRRSGSFCLTDSPGGKYQANTDASTTLAQGLNLSGSKAPVLSFWHRMNLTYGTYATVEISTNGGFDWLQLQYWYDDTFSTWNQCLIDLKAYKAAHVKIRFRLTSGSSLAEGWFVDDVRIEEQDTVRLPLPLADDFESGLGNWVVSGRDWGLTNSPHHSGSFCLTDSPGGNYPTNTDAAATLAHGLNLSGTTAPVLSFWHHMHLTYGTYAIVEISTNGGFDWLQLHYWYDDTFSTWNQCLIDLKAYKAAQVKIRFHLTSGSDVAEGWFVDDIEVYDELPPVNHPPQITPIAAQSVNETNTLTVSVQATDPDAGQVLTYSLLQAPPAAQIGATGVISWTPTEAQGPGDYLFQVKVMDNGQPPMAATASFNVHVLEVNSPPRLPVLSDRNLLLGQTLALPPIGATDSDLPANVLTYALVRPPSPGDAQIEVATGSITWTPSTTGRFEIRVRVTDNGTPPLSDEKSFYVEVASPNPVTATHSTSGYLSPGTNIVTCQISYPTGQKLWSLTWTPQLPDGWTLLSATGDGNPEVSGSDIVFLGFNLGNPLSFTYTVAIPPNQNETKFIHDTVTYYLSGMTNFARLMAAPDPLPVNVLLYHSADYRDPRWIIDNEEVSRVLLYWRALAYHVDPSQPDGYNAGPGNTNGRRHIADYRTNDWQIDGTEVNRVLAYWRSGCYRADTNGPDGYAPGCSLVLHSAAVASLNSPMVSQDTALTYVPGGTLYLTNTFYYEGPLQSLLWRPLLPEGWTIQSISGDGDPEMVAGEAVWTEATIPSSPIQTVATVQVPAGDHHLQAIRNEWEYLFKGMVKIATRNATPDPLALGTVIIIHPTVKNGQLEWQLVGESGRTYQIQHSTDLSHWTNTQTLTVSGDRPSFIESLTAEKRFYRAILLP